MGESVPTAGPPEISTVPELIAAARATTGGFNNTVAWWRGHSEASWSLKPGVFRREGGYRYEQNILRQFIQRAQSRRDRCPPGEDFAAWMFLAQHYRLPTRLLDWTESPLFAAYFACQRSSGDGALFAISPFLLNKQMIDVGGLVSTASHEAKPIVLAALARESEKSNTTGKALALISDEVDIRMLVQLSAFTIHADATPLDAQPESDKYVVKFIIPAKAKAPMLDDLRRLGVRQSTLFPDLENLAAELAAQVFRQTP